MSIGICDDCKYCRLKSTVRTMTYRERLIELLSGVVYENIEPDYDDYYIGIGINYENIADHLLANGVIVPPDHKSLFWTAENMLEQWNEVTGAIPQNTSWYYELLSIIEDTVNLSFGAGVLYKEKAEQALKEREKV